MSLVSVLSSLARSVQAMLGSLPHSLAVGAGLSGVFFPLCGPWFGRLEFTKQEGTNSNKNCKPRLHVFAFVWEPSPKETPKTLRPSELVSQRTAPVPVSSPHPCEGKGTKADRSNQSEQSEEVDETLIGQSHTKVLSLCRPQRSLLPQRRAVFCIALNPPPKIEGFVEAVQMQSMSHLSNDFP